MTIKDISLKSVGLKVFCFFIAICPIFFYNSKVFGFQTLRIGQLQFYQLGVTVLFCVLMLENIYLSIFLLWSVALYAYYNFPPMSGAYVMNIFFGCLLYQMSYKLVNKHNLKYILNTLIAVCFLNVGWLVLQGINYELIFMDKGDYQTLHMCGFFGLKAFMGMFFAMCLPFLLSRNVWLAPTFLIPIYVSESSCAMIGAVAVLIWHLYQHSRGVMKKTILCLLSTIILLAGSLYVYQDSHSGMFTARTNGWKVMLRDAFKHPFIGWGLDSFRNVGKDKNFMYVKNDYTELTAKYTYHKETNRFIPPKDFIKQDVPYSFWDHPHNEYISLLYEFGLVPFFILAFLIRDVLKRFNRANRDHVALLGFFIAILVFGIGQFPMHVARIGYLVPVLLGAYYKITKETENV